VTFHSRKAPSATKHTSVLMWGAR